MVLGRLTFRSRDSGARRLRKGYVKEGVGMGGAVWYAIQNGAALKILPDAPKNSTKGLSPENTGRLRCELSGKRQVILPLLTLKRRIQGCSKDQDPSRQLIERGYFSQEDGCGSYPYTDSGLIHRQSVPVHVSYVDKHRMGSRGKKHPQQDRRDVGDGERGFVQEEGRKQYKSGCPLFVKGDQPSGIFLDIFSVRK